MANYPSSASKLLVVMAGAAASTAIFYLFQSIREDCALRFLTPGIRESDFSKIE
jgi:hypothetical protein